MRRFTMTAVSVVTVCLVIAASAANWPQFLGPDGGKLICRDQKQIKCLDIAGR